MVDTTETTQPLERHRGATDPTVVLIDDHVHMARNAVRDKLRHIFSKYRVAERRGEALFAEQRTEQFDRWLELYERLGGNPDLIPDPEDPGTWGEQIAQLQPEQEQDR